jgi:transposase
LRDFKPQILQPDRPVTLIQPKTSQNHHLINAFNEPYVKTEIADEPFTANMQNKNSASLGTIESKTLIEKRSISDEPMDVNECVINDENETDQSSDEDINEFHNENENKEDKNVNELIDNVNAMMRHLVIAQPVLAKELDINRNLLQRFLKDRKPWLSHSRAERLRFNKIRDWYMKKKRELELTKIPMSNQDLVDRINRLLERRAMSVRKLAEQLNFKEVVCLSNLLKNPQPWETLIEAKRVNMKKLYTWYIENKGDEENDGDESFFQELDTEKLTSNVRSIIERIGLSVKELSEKLDMGRTSLSDIINYPKQWKTLSNVIKNYYRKLNDWYVKTMVDVASGKLALKTSEFVKKVEALLIRIDVSVDDMIKEVGIERDLFCYPMIWQDLNKAQRSQYLKLNAWYVRNSKEDSVNAAADDQVLDTKELVDKVRALTERLGLSIKSVALRLDIGRVTLTNLLNFPQPWDCISGVKKDHYRRLNAWFIKNKGNKPPKTVKRLNGTKKKPAQKRMTNQCGDVELDTSEVARKIVKVLAENEIGVSFFSDLKLRIKRAYFERLVNEPKPWQELSLGDRVLFNRMHQWNVATKVEIDALKQHYIKFKLYLSKKN